MNQADFLGKGWKFPIRVNGRGGLSYVTGEQSIAEAIWIILSTPPNSRIMEPEFGCGIHEYVFAPNNPNTIATVAHEVTQRAAALGAAHRCAGRARRQRSRDAKSAADLCRLSHPCQQCLSQHCLPFYINEGRGQ